MQFLFSLFPPKYLEDMVILQHYSSVLWFSLRLRSQNTRHVCVGSLPAVGSIQSRIAFSLQSNSTRDQLEAERDHFTQTLSH